jgi:hypothetical protein
MFRILFLLSILLAAVSTQGQVSSGKIQGTVKDSTSNIGLELATISIFAKDSTLINYQLSDKNGEFSIAKLPVNRELRLDVSYVGYKSHKQYFKLDSANTSLRFNIVLDINMEDSNAVVVKSVVPIRMNGDTLEINPAAFKMEKTAVAEELLNQVPGIIIWSDGTITVNGRPVPKILVDGKPFMNQNDPTVATQNLPKNAIEKIQLYQELDRSKEQRENTEQDSIFTMNIKLKENKKVGFFGKAGAGYGTNKRYESDMSLQAYDKRRSLAIGGGFNNVNKNVGSVQQMLSNNTFRKSNPNIFNTGSFGRSGISKSFSLGAVYAHSFIYADNGSRTNNIGTEYTNSGSDNLYESKSVQERTTKDFSQYIESANSVSTTNRAQNLGVNYTKSNATGGNYNISAAGNFNNGNSFSKSTVAVMDSLHNLQSTNQGNSTGTNNSQAGNISFNLNNYPGDEPVKRININGTAGFNSNNNERNARSIFDSYTDPSADTSFNRRYINSTETANISIGINYQGFRRLLFRRFNLFGIDLNLLQFFNYDHNKTAAVVSDYDSMNQKFNNNPALTNNNNLQAFRYNPGLVLTRSFNKWHSAKSRNISVSLRLAQSFRKEINRSSFDYRNVDRSFSFFTPSINTNYNYNVKNRYSLSVGANLNRNFSYPGIDQLYTIIDSINLYSVRVGNPYLKNTRTDNLSLNLALSKRKPKAKYEINGSVNGNIGFKNNPVADSIINNLSGKRVLYYVNADDGLDMNMSYSANISRKIRKNSIQLQYNGNISNNRSTNFIDAIESNNQTRSLSHNISFQYSYKTTLILKLSEVISSYNSRQSASGLASFKVTNSSTQFGATLNLSKDLSFNTTFSTTDNSSLEKNIILWHAFGSYRFLKEKQGELKFSAFDLLKKFQNVNVNAGIDGTTTTITNGLQQYFMLSFAYYPRKFGKKANGD